MKVTTKTIKLFNVELTEQEMNEAIRITKEQNCSQALAFLWDMTGMVKDNSKQSIR